MKNMKFTPNDIKYLETKGISLEKVQSQIKAFIEGFPSIEIQEAAIIGNGIRRINEVETETYINLWNGYRQQKNVSIFKFVPASGAATRMFKNLFEFLETSIESDFIKKFYTNLKKFAFFEDLNAIYSNLYGKKFETLQEKDKIRKIIKTLLEKEGLNYSNLPKGLLKFHYYKDGIRTPIEEHFIEGARYALAENNKVNLHFTISPEHKQLFIKLTNELRPLYENKLNIKLNISFSEQNVQTDTIAVDLENNPIRDKEGNLLFRPAGHGALLQNLNDIDANIIFIKNIDNVVQDRYKEIETKYKKALAGYMIDIQSQIFKYLETIDQAVVERESLLTILSFVENTLNITKEGVSTLNNVDLVKYLHDKLDRPIRICGMVKNEGEAGGGPFFTKNSDKSISLQILEGSQIDKNNLKYKKIQEESSHFNPVDIICGVKNYKNKKFNLLDYTDPKTGFISQKSNNGKNLKALELPGLWNGSMSNWNTIFVEVPLDTFNPVKNVNDLLREHHQPTV